MVYFHYDSYDANPALWLRCAEKLAAVEHLNADRHIPPHQPIAAKQDYPSRDHPYGNTHVDSLANTCSQPVLLRHTFSGKSYQVPRGKSVL